METPPATPTRNQIITWWSSIVGVCLVIVFGSVFVTRSYLARHEYEAENWRPPYVAKLEKDLQAVNRDGEPVSLSQLRHKVYVAGYQYTACPAGCLGMAGVMRSLHEQFGEEEDFFLVSISVDSENDTPEAMNAWVEEHGVAEDNWWFLSGDPEEIEKYMVSQFKFYGTARNTDPEIVAAQGEYSHDLRLVIVDGDANVRGYYDVMNFDRGEVEYQRLLRDLKMVLDPGLKLSDFAD